MFKFDFKGSKGASALFYSSKVSMEDMEAAVKEMEKQGYTDVKVVSCPQFKEPRF
jgi:hypothetical protein